MSESSSDGKERHSNRYISVPRAMQLIPKQFTGNPVELRDLIQNVEAAYVVVEPAKYSLLFKFVCAKIGGEAKTKLLARTHVNNWEQAKTVLEENYSVRRTLDYYAHRPSTASSDRMKQLANGAHKLIPCAETYRGQRVTQGGPRVVR